MAEINIDLAEIRENGIYLMLPAYGGQCFAAFSRSLMQLTALCTQYQIPFDVFFIYNESLISRARNYCADMFLNAKFKTKDANGNITEHHFKHGIFIDADIEFNAIDVLVMAHLQNNNSDYDIICGPYPKKHISWEKITRAVEKGFADEDPNNLENFVGDYVFNAIGTDRIGLNEPFEVHESGTGFMMFRRETLEKIARQKPEILYKPDHSRSENFNGDRMISAFFDTAIDPKTKRYLSEDYYFCHLARECGMKVWMVPWFNIKHHGYFIFGGSLGALAQAGVSATVDIKEIKKGKKRK